MCCLGVFKRVVPFILTFAAGLFIASFFVTITAPNFGNSRRQIKFREMQRVRMEVEQLRDERTRLKEEIENLRNERREAWESKFQTAPNIDFAVPPPPIAPTVNGKTKTVTITIPAPPAAK